MAAYLGTVVLLIAILQRLCLENALHDLNFNGSSDLIPIALPRCFLAGLAEVPPPSERTFHLRFDFTLGHGINKFH